MFFCFLLIVASILCIHKYIVSHRVIHMLTFIHKKYIYLQCLFLFNVYLYIYIIHRSLVVVYVYIYSIMCILYSESGFNSKFCKFTFINVSLLERPLH